MTGNDDSDSPEFLELEPLEEGDGGDAPLEDDAIEPVDDAANSGAHDGEDAFEDVSGGGLDLPDIVSQPKKPDTTEEGLSGGSSAADASGPDSSGEPSTTDALANIVGQRLEGTYEIVEKIGQGGMGTVYAAIQHPLERKVAIKLVKPSDRAEGNELYFKREVRAIHMLRHPNIINIVDFGADANGVLYLITEYLSGRTLRKVIDEDCPLAPIRICNIAAQMLSALDEAHSEGIVHCDLKPANIMLEPDAEGHDFVKVLDFGIAEIKSPNDEVGPHTQEGDLVGTFDYMSPEQIMREGVDGRADVWSVGVLLYEMLTKRRIFHADDGASIIGRVMRADIPRPEEIAEGVPPELSDVVMAALRRDLDRRLESASAMRSRILEARDQIQSRQTTVDPSVEPGDAPSLRETAARPFDPGRRGELQPDSDSPPANNQSEVSADRETSSPSDDSAWGGVGESAQTLSSDMSPTDIEVEEVRDIGGDEGEASRDDESLEGVEGEVVDEIASAFDDESLEEALFETDDESSGDLSRVSTLDAEAFEEESSPPADGGSHDDRASSTETQRSKSPSSKSAGVETSLDREEPSESQPPPGSSDTHEPPPRELTGVDVHVEREELRDQLVRSTAEAPERGGRVLHLVGSPECGKSTLVDHVADTFASRDWAIARARGDGPEGASLLPVMQWIAKLADLYRDPHGFLECALDLVGLEVTLEETSQFFADPSARGESGTRPRNSGVSRCACCTGCSSSSAVRCPSC